MLLQVDRPTFCIPTFAPATTLTLTSDTSAPAFDTGADPLHEPSCSVQILGNLTILTINMDGGARWNYTLVCDLILRKKADITILIDTRLNKFGGSQSKLIIRQLGSAYTEVQGLYKFPVPQRSNSIHFVHFRRFSCPF